MKKDEKVVERSRKKILKHQYVPPVIRSGYKEGAKRLTIPNQALSIQEIMKRFVRNIPVDVLQREAVYVPGNSDDDLERVARADYFDRVEYAEGFKARAEAMNEELNDERAKNEEARKVEEEKAKEAKPKAGAEA